MHFVSKQAELNAEEYARVIVKRAAFREKLFAVLLYSAFGAVMIGWLLLLAAGIYWLI